jgi:hypothetical protein
MDPLEVTINGEVASMGESWNYTDSKQLIISTIEPHSFVEIWVEHTAEGSDLAPLPSPKPAAINFTSVDCFNIPSRNGTINFKVDGSIDEATLNADTWNFVNLTLSTYSINAGTFAPNVTGRDVLPYIYQFGYPASMGVSVENCNISITGIIPLTWHSYAPRIDYAVSGVGSQILTLPFELAKFDWTVVIDSVSKQKGDDWSIIGDNQLKIVNATTNVTISGVLKPVSFPPAFYYPLLDLIIIAVAAATIGSIAFIWVRHKSKSHTRPDWTTTINNSKNKALQ